MAPGSFISGLIAAALRVFGAASSVYGLWATLSLMSALAGLFAARRSLLDERAAARWLDRRLGAHQLLSAAQTCIRRPEGGRFDQAIIEQAVGLVSRAEAIKPPLRQSYKKLGLAAAAAALGAYAILLAAAADFSAFEKADAWTESGAPLIEAAAAAIAEGGSSASDFASAIFPDNKRMATLAERALREGRFDELLELLDTAGMELDIDLERELNELERRKLTRDRTALTSGLAALKMALAEQTSAGGGAGGGDVGGDSGAGEGGAETEGRGEDQGPADENPQAGEEETQTASIAGGKGPLAEDDAAEESLESPLPPEATMGSNVTDGEYGKGLEGDTSDSGRNYGVGEGWEGSRDPVVASAGEAEALIEQSANSAFFELILPDETLSSALKTVIGPAERSAEAAMSRTVLPLEYEDFVKSYFMALSQGEE